MTKEEKALIYFKDLRERKVKDYSSMFDTAPKGTVVYEAVSAEIEIYDTAIKALEQEPKTGHWILTSDDDYEYCTCSECGYQNGENWMIGSQIEYCSHCGAKMQEVEE